VHAEMADEGRSSLAAFGPLKRLGAGSFGEVWSAERLQDNTTYVLKGVAISELSYKEQLGALNEVKLLADMDCPHVVRYFDSFVEGPKLYIVMEMCEKGDLSQMLKRTKDKGGALAEPMVWSLLTQILLGLHYLHTKKVRGERALLLLLLLLVLLLLLGHS
jgi:serine/threonine protein kinase